MKQHLNITRCGIWAIVGLLSLASTSLADAVKIGGFWIDDVTVMEIVDGQVLYLTAAGGESNRMLNQLEGLKLSAYPQTVEAEDAIEAGNWQAAHDALAEAMRGDRPEWVRNWLRFRAMKAANEAGQPVAAVRYFADLVADRAHPAYTTQPPLSALAQASDADKTAARRALEQVRPEARGEVAKFIDALLAQLPADGGGAAGQPADGGQPSEPTTPGDNGQGDAQDPLKNLVSGGEVELPDESAWPIASNLDREDPITQKLVRGEFEEALAETQKALDGYTGGRMATLLYQQGVAQIALAHTNNDEKLYKDAGVSFMRLISYYPRSALVYPAWVEVGAVHEVLGREQIARKAYEQAIIGLDEEADAALYARLESLQTNGTDGP